MDEISTGDTTSDATRARRKRMRADARGLRLVASPDSDRYQTPEWLDRSFVLPLTRPEVTGVPSQSAPDHDNFPEVRLRESAVPAQEAFVRPPSREIDFARVIKRADLGRKATRLAMASTGIACVALIVFLLTSSSVLVTVAIAAAVTALVCVGVRVRLSTAPIPHLER